MRKLTPTLEVAVLVIGGCVLLLTLTVGDVHSQWQGIAAILIMFGLVGTLYGSLAAFFRLSPSPLKYCIAITIAVIGCACLIAQPDGLLAPALIPLGGGVLMTLVLQSVQNKLVGRKSAEP